MTGDQRRVAIGAVSGVLFIGMSVWLLQKVLPVPAAAIVGERLGYAAKWCTLPGLLFFMMIVAVGNARFFSEAIDPTLGKESQRMIVDGRVADNTTQQLLIFVIAALALSASLPAEQLTVIGAAAITFTIVRLAFWIGYRIRPVYRAFGFAGTAYLNLGLLVSAIYLAVR